MKLKQHQNLSAFLTPDDAPEPADGPLPADGTRPQWKPDSDENLSSWRDTFMGMAAECREFSEPPEPPQPPPATPVQRVAQASVKDAWKSNVGDDIIILMSDENVIRVPCRRVGADTGNLWITMHVPQPVWDLWRAQKPAMKQIGFRAVRDNGQWQMKLCQPEGAVLRFDSREEERDYEAWLESRPEIR